MQVLVVYGSGMGGTFGIAEVLTEALEGRGLRVECVSGSEVEGIAGWDAVVVGGGLYAGRWHSSARRFVRRHIHELRQVPVFFFSSGPLDDSASEKDIAATPSVRALMNSAETGHHRTFGGRLEEASASGLVARALVRRGEGGDFRDVAQIRTWAEEIADALATVPSAQHRQAGNASPEMDRANWTKRRWARRIATGLCALASTISVVGAIELLRWRDGAAWLPPVTVLEATAFEGFLLPGLILLAGVALVNLWAAARAHRRAPAASVVVTFAGGLLFGWITTEMMLLGGRHWLQLAYLGLGFAIMVAGALLGRVNRVRNTPRPRDARRSIA